MAEFMLLTRVWENQTTGELSHDPFFVNADHVRAFRPNPAGGTWVDWNAATAPPTKVVEDFETVGVALGIFWEVPHDRP